MAFDRAVVLAKRLVQADANPEAGPNLGRLAHKLDLPPSLPGRHFTPIPHGNALHRLWAHRPGGLGALLGEEFEIRVLLALLPLEITERVLALVVCLVRHDVLVNQRYVFQTATTRERVRVLVDHVDHHAVLHAVVSKLPPRVIQRAYRLAVRRLEQQLHVVHLGASMRVQLVLDLLDGEVLVQPDLGNLCPQVAMRDVDDNNILWHMLVLVLVQRGYVAAE
mmetsp:Transcript_6775/g.21479  ORF Transcript_6775/g.21479 Transcript_6775/m.21479 type:complete len:222 (+) Transcript_6775:532-1197(+)